MAVRIIKTGYMPRAAWALSRVAPEGDVAPYDTIQPGLYPDETVAQLESGERVAVSVQRKPLDHGMMEFRGWARLIEADGRTKIDAFGRPIENEFAHTATVSFIDAAARAPNQLSGEQQLSREILLALLGEPLTEVEIDVDPDAPPVDAPAGTVLEPDKAKGPILALAQGVLDNVSIRAAIRLAGTEPEGDAAALLAAG